MTLQELLKAYGIHRPSDLAKAAKIDRRHAWLIWRGKAGIGATVALRLYESKQIPIHELLEGVMNLCRNPGWEPTYGPD